MNWSLLSVPSMETSHIITLEKQYLSLSVQVKQPEVVNERKGDFEIDLEGNHTLTILNTPQKLAIQVLVST